MNSHCVFTSNHYINGYLNTRNGNTFTLNSLDKILVPQKSIITEIDFYYPALNLLCNIVAGKVIITSAVSRGITFNPVVFASFTGFGLVVKAVASFKKYDKKAEKANFARVEYRKILDAIRFYIRGQPFNKKALLHKLKVVDDFISDHCMEIPAKVEKKI